MANRNFQPVQVLNRGVKVIAGTIQINASAAVAGSVGNGFSVAKTGTGLYTITLEDAYMALTGGGLALQKAAAAAVFVEMVSNDVVTAKTIVLRTINGSGTAIDVAAAVDVVFEFHLRNSDVVR